MTTELEHAEKWFQLHNVPTVIENDTIHICSEGFEFELSEEEIWYRAQLYERYYQKKCV